MTVQKLKNYLDSGHDHYVAAGWLINHYIGKHAPVSLQDLPDTATVGNEIEAIVECLDAGDLQDAINIAEDGAAIILEDEGFEF